LTIIRHSSRSSSVPQAMSKGLALTVRRRTAFGGASASRDRGIVSLSN
jgi:hypothetical protein